MFIVKKEELYEEKSSKKIAATILAIVLSIPAMEISVEAEEVSQAAHTHTYIWETDSVNSDAEYYDIVTETEKIFSQTSENTAGNIAGNETVIGMQFYQGEPVKLVQASEYENGTVLKSIRLYRADGSSNILLQNLSEHCIQGFIDEEGSFYSVQIAASGENSKYDIVKVDGAGKPIFHSRVDGVPGYMGQLSSGKVVVELLGSGLRLLDAETGELSEPEANVQAARG